MLPHHKSLNDNVWPPPQPASTSPIAGGSEQDSCSSREPSSLAGGEASHAQLQQLSSAAGASVSGQGATSTVLSSASEPCTEVKGAVNRRVNVHVEKCGDEEKSFRGATSQVSDSEPGPTESSVCSAHGSVCRSSGCVGCHHHDGSNAHGSPHGRPTAVNSTVIIDPVTKIEYLNEEEKFIPVAGDSSEKLVLGNRDVSVSSSCSPDFYKSSLVDTSNSKFPMRSGVNIPSIPSPSVSIDNAAIAPSCIEDFSSLSGKKTELPSSSSASSIPDSSNAHLPTKTLSELPPINSVSDAKLTESSKVSLLNGKVPSAASASVDAETGGVSNSNALPSSSEQGIVSDRPTTSEQSTSTDNMPEQTPDQSSSASSSNRPTPNDATPQNTPQQPEADAGALNAAGFPNVRIAVPTNLNQLRERMFRSLFLRASVAYARSTTPFIRRLLEFILLIKSLGCLFLLMLVHLYLCNQSPACLPAGTAWDKNGILRVEVIPSPDPSYSLARSYQKEELLHRRYTMDGGTIIFTAMEEFNKVSDAVLLDETMTPSWKVETASEPYAETTEGGGETSESEEPPELSWAEHVSASVREMSSPFFSPFAMGILRLLYDGNQLSENKGASNGSSEGAAQSCSAEDAPNPLLPPTTCPALPDFLPLQEEEEVYFYMPEDAFIMEYALDYGLLRLSGATRKRLGVPVTLVVLDPNTNPCFGDGFSTFLLSNLVGYDELLLAAVKTLAENDGGKGYLRNVVTGEHYRFVSTWLGGTNYVGAGLVMVVFTLSVSLLLRYSHHQIFLFIVHLLHMMEINATAMASFPAAPMLTVILALVGMEAIMSEFFKDTTTAFYIIVMVWVCDQYETLCCTQPITRKHWLRFFYLYHFAFYAYHYRFNGQYSWLALMTSWFFLQHSMLYFYHHYELPAMLRSRPRLQAVNIVVRRPPGEPATESGTTESGASTSGTSGTSAASTSGASAASTSGASAASTSGASAASTSGTSGADASETFAVTPLKSDGTGFGSITRSFGSSTETPQNDLNASRSSITTSGPFGCNRGISANNETLSTLRNYGTLMSSAKTSGMSKFCTTIPDALASDIASQGRVDSSAGMCRASDHEITSISAKPNMVGNQTMCGNTISVLNFSEPVNKSTALVPPESVLQNCGLFHKPTPGTEKIDICKPEGISSGVTCTSLSSGSILLKPNTLCATPTSNSVTQNDIERDTNSGFSSNSFEIPATASISGVVLKTSVGQPTQSECNGSTLPNGTGCLPNTGSSCVLDSGDKAAALTREGANLFGERAPPSNSVTPADSVAISDTMSTSSSTKSDAMFIPDIACVRPVTAGIRTELCGTRGEVDGSFSGLSASVSSGFAAQSSRR